MAVNTNLGYLVQFRIANPDPRFTDGNLIVWAADDEAAQSAANELIANLNARLEPKYPIVLTGVILYAGASQ